MRLADLHHRLEVGDEVLFDFGAERDTERDLDLLLDLVAGAGFLAHDPRPEHPQAPATPGLVAKRGTNAQLSRPERPKVPATRGLVAKRGTNAQVSRPERGWVGAKPGLLSATRERTLADTVAPGMRMLVCGLNPSLYAADVGVGFARPGNRFWPAALDAGLVTLDRDPLHALRVDGVGMTDLVKHATARADELSVEEYRAGLERVERLVRWSRPGVILFVGLTGWRVAVDPKATAGPQTRSLGDAAVYVMPSTSGANAHASLATLTDHLHAAMQLVC